MKNAVLFLLFIVSSIACTAQVSTDTPDGILDNFFRLYEKEGSKAAIENIYTYGDESMQRSKEYVKDTITHTAEMIGGKFLGHELIIRKNLTPSLCLYSYLVKFPYAPLRFTFVFYKPKDKWMVQNFSFDSNVIGELTRSGRLDGGSK